MKKRWMILFAAFLVTGMTACSSGGDTGSETESNAEDVVEPAVYMDGVYEAEAEAYENGWKDKVTITVTEGKIVDVVWNGTAEDGGSDKKTRSMDGEYPMVAEGGAQDEWYVQAGRMEQELIDTQSVDAIVVTSDGYTDAVTGVTIHVNGFVALAQEALAQAI